MTRTITFTFDVEDHRPHRDAWPARYPGFTLHMLDFLEARGVLGTFFVVGELGEEHPELVREIGRRGHEVGLHGWRHVHLTRLSPESFAADVRKGKALLEDLSGREVHGFRAPTGSLVPSTFWATEILAEQGFTYSSSVVNGRFPLFTFPGCPSYPYRWPGGLAEIPVPTITFAGYGAGALGGIFLRVLPWPYIKWFADRLDRPILLTYGHPYDYDPDEPFWVVGEVGRLGSIPLWYNRHNTFRRLDRLLAGRAGAPLLDRIHELGGPGALPVWDPRDSGVEVAA